MLWVILALLTGVSVIAVLWPMLRTPRVAAPDAADKGFYAGAIASIEHDLHRGLIATADAEAAKVEAARRLLAAVASRPVRSNSRWRLRIAAFGSVLLMPALALGLYAFTGNPDYPDQPLQARLNAAPAEMDVSAAVAKIEQRLRENSDDARGWEVVAPIYMKLGRAADAAEAYRNLLRIEGMSADRASAFGQALTYAARGTVTPQARAAFEAALAEDPAHPQSRFFMALAHEQDGDRDAAIAAYQQLVTDAPSAPWAPVVRERLARLGGEAPEGNPAAGIASMAPAERDQAIRGMVAGLAARLAQNGGDVEAWSRLIRAYSVLQEADKAKAALADARRALAGEAGAILRIDELASELGLEG